MIGGSALRSPVFFGMIWLLSMPASTRSSAITRSPCGIALLISATISCIWLLSRVGKFESVIVKTEKSTRRSLTDTLVWASAVTVPSTGLVAPDGV
jgi:hypothetical protein